MQKMNEELAKQIWEQQLRTEKEATNRQTETGERYASHPAEEKSERWHNRGTHTFIAGCCSAGGGFLFLLVASVIKSVPLTAISTVASLVGVALIIGAFYSHWKGGRFAKIVRQFKKRRDTEDGFYD